MSLFGGLEPLGFKEAELPVEDLYKREETLQQAAAEARPYQRRQTVDDNPMDYLYAKNIYCPVCGKTFMNYITRKSRLRLFSTDLDLKPTHLYINANCYDVYLCTHCGYAALQTYFNRVTDKQIEILNQKIRPSYKSKKYIVPLSLGDAAQRYKMALLCALTIGAKAGVKAILCLKTAWIYRDMRDKENERLFLKNARDGLIKAFETESFPIGAMDEMTVMYMIGELSRRVGDFTTASRWISEVVTSKGVKPRMKDRAMESKDLIREKVSV